MRRFLLQWINDLFFGAIYILSLSDQQRTTSIRSVSTVKNNNFAQLLSSGLASQSDGGSKSRDAEYDEEGLPKDYKASIVIIRSH